MPGVYVQADADFTAQLVYTAPDGSTLTKTLQVAIDRNATAEYPFPDSEIATFAERPTPAVTSGKITKVAKVNGTWLIWFNGEEAYCCTHGANGQPAGCPPYTYVNTSTVSADQCVPGDHYGNQIRIWGGLNQLSLGDADDLPTVFSADEGEEISLLDFCASIYDDVQMYIIENFPESTAAEIYLASADELANGVETYASARGYYTYMENFSIRDLADACSMSESHFRRVFRELVGMGPLDYLNRTRIAKACSLLRMTDDSILTISEKVGFGSMSSFNRHFYEVMGTAPSDWRRATGTGIGTSILKYSGWLRPPAP